MIQGLKHKWMKYQIDVLPALKEEVMLTIEKIQKMNYPAAEQRGITAS